MIVYAGSGGNINNTDSGKTRTRNVHKKTYYNENMFTYQQIWYGLHLY